MNALLSLVVLVPVLGAMVAASVPPRARAAVTISATVLTGVLTGVVGGHVASAGAVRTELAGWAPPLGIALVADGPSIAMVALSALVVLAAAVAGALDRRLIGSPSFWPLVGVAFAAVNGVFVAGDLFSIYVLLELLTLAAVGLVALGGAKATAPALRYLFVAVTGSLFYLLAVALVYGETGALDLAIAAERMPEGATAAAVIALVAVGMAAKMALFPLHSWLPVAHPAAPAAVSALLSALVIKASLFVLWRVFSALGPVSGLTPMLATVVAAAGATGVVWGGILALRRDRLKTVIAYSTVAQVGYLVLMLPLLGSVVGAEAAWSGGIVLAVAHGLAKAAMFLAAGSLVIAYGDDRLEGLHGALSRMPLTAATIGVAGVSLAGLPPALGFVGKWQLLQAALAEGAWWWVAVLLVGGLLTFAYTGRMIAAMFNVPGEDPPPPHETPRRALVAVPFALAALSLVLGLFPGPLVDLLVGTLPGGGRS
ncbi:MULTISPECIES: complex I subunit 5 family protein [Microbacterium]|uniref:complex I subunit 5 family protein n=1 Tax=Microbacterium TaxID=33882 RepID=UPI002780D9AD|nr:MULTISPECIES: proton-conducting transporter membrane subunit [Microbacterium]MDQ1081997.1 multicomponent Na+:H+ antiporter subunit D [Microbacterium sp. SORGH_AS_0344]MDQ1169236.1 multicomponent Na+:H+ antiporter subunit D [Microbacterium proteolyticum]